MILQDILKNLRLLARRVRLTAEILIILNRVLLKLMIPRYNNALQFVELLIISVNGSYARRRHDQDNERGHSI